MTYEIKRLSSIPNFIFRHISLVCSVLQRVLYHKTAPSATEIF
jgi:hypothetical protein